MYWSSTDVSGHRERILFADTYDLGGRAVYYDSRDTATTITCTAACTRRWLPLLESELKPGFLAFSARALSLVRPGESGGRYVCELLASLPDSSA
jgi:hypothetical protein